MQEERYGTCDRTKEPVALIETARDVGQAFKAATVTARLAKRAGLPAYVVLYTPASDQNPSDPEWRGIARFRVRSWKSAKLDQESRAPVTERPAADAVLLRGRDSLNACAA